MIEKDIKNLLSSGQIPNHIAIIMDGNGRWAKSRKLPRLAGHKEGINSVRKITRICGEIGVGILTLYTFSTENWSRPKTEVSALMKLLLKSIKQEVKELHKNNVRFTTIGDLNKLPNSTRKGIEDGIEKTKNNTGLNLVLALNYGSRQEILNAVESLTKCVQDGTLDPKDIDEEKFTSFLYTKSLPDPDLLIRTSGELRLSNFLLWQSAYTELYITETFWPAFREDALIAAIQEYQSRERRYGTLDA
ncbi:MAG: isoprenyl transferase [Candidatus Marinimicrobia bacterium]|nr:isoprenyl transferase [Candidatus Neomarinimicrobiota bacterium]